MNRGPASGTMLIVLAMLATLVAAAPSAASPASGPVNAVGYEIDLDNLPSPHPRPGEAAGPPPEAAAPAAAEAAGNAAQAPSPLYVKVGIPWAQVEKVAGQYDWAVADEIVLSHAQAGYAMVLQPRGDNPLYQPLATRDQTAVDAWTAFLRALSGRYQNEAGYYALVQPVRDLPAKDWAYLLKLSAVMIRSSDAGARIAMWDLDVSRQGAAASLETLYAEGIAAYVDVLVVTGALAAPGETELAAVKAQIQLNDPGCGLWLAGNEVAGGEATGGRLLRAFLQGLEREAGLSFFRIDFGPEGKPYLLPVLERVRALFAPSYTPLVESGRGIKVTTSMGEPLAVATVRLFDPDAKKVLIGYDAGEGTARGTQAVMSIDTADLADPVLMDVAAGESAPLGAYQKDESAGLTRAAVPLADYPLVLEYRRFTSPLYGQGEKLQVTEKRLPSVEEIIAHYQAVQASQDALLQNMRAQARVEYHFSVGAGSTFDVTVLNNFYLDPKVGGEFEQKEFFVNGVKWRSDRIPEFPLPQPEKVMTLPLDIALDKRYAYTLAGEQTIEGYDCWMVDFEPLEAGGSLYKGRVWIDKKMYARVQISSLQTGLKSPIISNDEKDSYRPVRGPDGLDYWLLARIDGQQVYSALGRNLVLVREVTLTDHVINDAGFADLRSQAYASNHQILRDTPSGQRYLERTPEGGRVVKEELNRDYLFLVGGAFYDHSLDYPLPLAGVNYFNRDLGGKGIQTDVLFGGVLLFGNASDPSLFGTKMDGSLDVIGQAYPFTDTPVRNGHERDQERVRSKSQDIGIGLGLPFADYWKVKLTADLEYWDNSRHKDTDPNFTIPPDTLITTAGFQGEFNRKTWSVVGSIGLSQRSRWDCWGPDCANATAEDLALLSEAKGYVRYEGTVAKDFFLPLNQKVHTSVSAVGGSDLDRFSEYRFGFFGNRVRGFSGAGFRFTNGAKAQVQYAFNLGNVIRFDATIDHAEVRDRVSPDRDYKSFTGMGLSGQTILGPNLIVRLDWGIAVASDVREFRGDQELLLTVLRLFR